MATLLLRGSQPDVNVISLSGGRSTLYTATTIGHEVLILAGADVDFEDPEDGHSVLHEAICGGHEPLAIELIGADVNAEGSYATRDPLHDAAEKGLKAVVSALLLRDAEKDAIDDRGYTALMVAIDHGRFAVVETLLAAGADFNIRSIGGDSSKRSALHLAADRGNVPVLQALLQGGMDADACDESGLSALHISTENGQVASIDALIGATR